MTRPIIMLLLAALGFTAYDLLASQTTTSALLVVPGLILTQGIIASLIVKGQKTKQTMAWPLILKLTIIDFVQTWLYIISLVISSPGPMAALHMTVPIWFLIYEIILNKKINKNQIIALILFISGIGFLFGKPSPELLLGSTLSLISAVLLAVLLNMISKSEIQTFVLMKWRSLLMFMLSTPLFIYGITQHPLTQQFYMLAIIGGIIVTIAVALQWEALPKLPPNIFSSLVISEVFMVAIGGLIFFDKNISMLQMIAMLLLIAAIFWQIWHSIERKNIIQEIG